MARRRVRPPAGCQNENSWQWAVAALLVLSVLTGPARALDSSDLLFQLSFENGLAPELARGSAAPVTLPTQLNERLVDGLFGRGYRFAGKGSGIEFATGNTAGPAACDEMYSVPANFFGDSGTVSFWVKPLTNSHDMMHYLFLCNGPGTFQIMKASTWSYHHGAKSSGINDGLYRDEWLHFAVTFQKGRSRAYMNGKLHADILEAGVLSPTPVKFLLASEGNPNGAIQKEFVDDAVMDEVQIFRRPLAEEEVLSLFERGHTTVHQPAGYGDTIVSRRAWELARLGAPRPPKPITVDGDLSDWQGLPAHGGLIERRVGVLDGDDARLWVAADDQNLYLAFRTEVDKDLQADPTHVKYPTGPYKAGVSGRDADVYADDYVEWTLRDAQEHVYRLAVNARDGFLDSRDGDKSWNANATVKSRSNFVDWTAEVAVPLADLGLTNGSTLGFNVVRSWKLFKSAQNSLCVDERSQPALGTLAMGASATAAVSGLGAPEKGDLRVTGSILGPAGSTGSPQAGEYTVRLIGQGRKQSFTNEQKVVVAAGLTPFEVRHRLEQPGDLGLVIQVLSPAGEKVFVRTIPIVFAASTAVELSRYPGWGKLDVTVTPMGVTTTNDHAEVAMEQAGRAVRSQAIPVFDEPMKTVRFETANLATGRYDIVTRLYRNQAAAGEDHQSYEKQPPPDWFHSTVGTTDGPPPPWTDVKVRRRVQGSGFRVQGWKTVIECLLKKITFRGTLFPAEILSNGQDLLASPIRLRVTRGSAETVITAGKFRITDTTRRRVSWTAEAQDGDLRIKVDGWIEFDGFTWIALTFSGINHQPSTIDHVQLEIPLRKESATLSTLKGGLTGATPIPLPYVCGGYWFGNEKAGLQYHWQSNKGWVLKPEGGVATPTNDQVLVSIPFIQKPFTFDKPRTVEFGWAITPSKPIRKDWRFLSLHRGVFYTYADHAGQTPNYAIPHEKKETYELWRYRQEQERDRWPICCYYAFGPFMWIGSPEYAEWWREWRTIPSALVKPDPNSNSWYGPACHNSSATELQLHLLEKYVRDYPQRGIYFDCMVPIDCGNEAHGCGYVNDSGVRQPETQLLADRRYYERVYNVMKSADPTYGWVRHHDWSPSMVMAAFCDDNWLGEGFCGAIAANPKHNYHDLLDLPGARLAYGKEHWGHLTSWLTEMSVYAGEDHEKRAEVYGKMISPPKDGKHGEWVLPKWKDYEHVAGLGVVHDMWGIGGNDLPVPWMVLQEVERLMGWDEHVQFTGYWETGNRLIVEGGVPEKIVCSMYHRPAGVPAPVIITNSAAYNADVSTVFATAPGCRAALAEAGARKAGWLILAPMNNTDEDVTLTLRPALEAFGLGALRNGQLRDIYRAYEGTWQPGLGWRANGSDPEAPYLVLKPSVEVFPLKDGAAVVPVARRNFRLLLLEESK